MKVFLLKNVPGVGMAGEIIKVSDGYGLNYLIPHKLGVTVTDQNESFYKNRIKQIENRKEVIATETSMLAQSIQELKLMLKYKTCDDNKKRLYGSVGTAEIAQALNEVLHKENIKQTVSERQVLLNKSIRETGIHKVKIKLSTRLQPEITVQISAAE